MGCGQVGKAPVSGTGDHRFESYHPSHTKNRYDSIGFLYDRYIGLEPYGETEVWCSKTTRRSPASSMVEMQNQVERYKDMPSKIREEVERIREQAREGQFGVTETIQTFDSQIGQIREGAQFIEAQQRWAELLNDDNTTVGQMREHLVSAMLKVAEEWQTRLDHTRGRLEQLAA